MNGAISGRPWGRKHVEARRRTRRLAPGVIGLCLIMILATCVLVGVPASARASGVSPDCVPCPKPPPTCYNPVTGCTPPPPPPPTCNGAPTINSYGAVVQSGYRQAWVNWTYTIPSSGNGWSPDFTWYLGSTQLSSPSYSSSTSSATVNLNDLTSGTTYSYTVGVSNCGGGATKSGTFTTSNAPTTGFVGWVYAQSLNSNRLDPDGASLTGATVWLSAYCYYPAYGPALPTLFDLGSTSSSGYYASPSFPLTNTQEWGGPYTLSSSGVCTTSGGYPTVANSHYLLSVDLSGYYQVERWVSSPLSVSNDFQQFATPANIGSLVPVALALVHTTYSGKTYNNAACDLTYSTSSTTETVSQSIGLNGQSGTAEQDTVGSGWSASGGAGWNVGLSLMYPFTGTINDSALTSSNLMSSSYVDGSDYGSSSGPYATTEWMPAPTYSPRTVPPAGWVFANPLNGNPLTQTLFQSGSYSSTSGFNVDLGLSVGWAGQAVSASIPIQATTTVATTTVQTVQCTFTYAADPSNLGGSPYFWVYVGSPVTSDVHIWLAGWCGGSSPEVNCGSSG